MAKFITKPIIIIPIIIIITLFVILGNKFTIEKKWANRNSTHIIANLPCKNILITNSNAMRIKTKVSAYGMPQKNIQLKQTGNEVYLDTSSGFFYNLTCTASATIPPGFKLSVPIHMSVKSISPAPIVIEKNNEFVTFGGILTPQPKIK